MEPVFLAPVCGSVVFGFGFGFNVFGSGFGSGVFNSVSDPVFLVQFLIWVRVLIPGF